MTERINSLVEHEKISLGDIAVLAPDKQTLNIFSNRDSYRLGKYAGQDSENRAAAQICVETIRRFKGLESAVVLLVLDSNTAKSFEMLYAGITRAQVLLEIFAPRYVINQLSDDT